MTGWFGKDARMERGYQRYRRYEAIYRNTVPTLCALAGVAALMFVLSHVNRVSMSGDTVVTEAEVLGVYWTRRDYLPTTQTLAAGFVSPVAGRVHALIEVSLVERRRLETQDTVKIRHDRQNPRAATLASRAPMNSIADRYRLLGWGVLLLTLLGSVIAPMRGAWLKRQRVLYADYVPVTAQRS